MFIIVKSVLMSFTQKLVNSVLTCQSWLCYFSNTVYMAMVQVYILGICLMVRV